jgi:hypothetical protein
MSYRGNLNNTQPVHTYLDINIVNNDTTGLSAPQPLIFNEVRNTPLVMNPSEYFFTIARFSLETPSLPLMIPQVQVGQPDVNKLIYSVTMTYTSPINGVTYENQTYITYIPQNPSASLPDVPLVSQDLGANSDYYYIYSYQYFIKLVNTTLATCLNGLNILSTTGGGGALPSLNPPFMEWDVFNNVAILDADIAGFNSTLANPIKLYFNTPMYTLFSSFQAQYLGFQNITNGKNYLISIYNINDTNVLTLPSYNALQMYQEYPTSSLWNPINSLVFTTGTLPVAPTSVSAPVVFGTNTSALTSGGNNSNISNQLTDFEVPVTEGWEYKPNVFYTPTAEYRFIDLLGNTPLNNIQISVFWKDAFGNLHPFYLNSGCNANIKCLFRRKDFNMTDMAFLGR